MSKEKLEKKKKKKKVTNQITQKYLSIPQLEMDWHLKEMRDYPLL